MQDPQGWKSPFDTYTGQPLKPVRDLLTNGKINEMREGR
jgi:hypothetical protein